MRGGTVNQFVVGFLAGSVFMSIVWWFLLVAVKGIHRERPY